MKIKICGLRRAEDAIMLNDFSEIGYIGLVFVASSKRKVNVLEAEEIIKNLRKDIKVVGVFADMQISEVKRIVEKLNLDIAQLHSDEDNEMCKELDCGVWKSISVKDSESLKVADIYKDVDGFVLDTFSSKMRGGTGESFNWEYVKGFDKEKFTILAGGINKDNIAEGIKMVKPDVIDVSSSVEVDGYKNYDKILDLIEAYRRECSNNGVK